MTFNNTCVCSISVNIFDFFCKSNVCVSLHAPYTQSRLRSSSSCSSQPRKMLTSRRPKRPFDSWRARASGWEMRRPGELKTPADPSLRPRTDNLPAEFPFTSLPQGRGSPRGRTAALRGAEEQTERQWGRRPEPRHEDGCGDRRPQQNQGISGGAPHRAHKVPPDMNTVMLILWTWRGVARWEGDVFLWTVTMTWFLIWFHFFLVRTTAVVSPSQGFLLRPWVKNCTSFNMDVLVYFISVI